MMSTALGSNQQSGWHILQPMPSGSGLLSCLSLEWDYFMVHDHAGAFTGSIGYVLAVPAAQKTPWLNRFTLLPSGVSVAIAGMFKDGSKIAEFINFPFQHVQLSASTKAFKAQDSDNALQVALQLQPDQGLRLEGRTHSIEYQLDIQADRQSSLLQSGDAFTPVTGRDMGRLPNEQWTIDVIWPRTRVHGYIRALKSNQTFEITGHGYRENSFGRWLFLAGGWDFAAMSDQTSGVQWVWQTYHGSQDLSYLDLSFPIDGVQHTARFWAREGQLQWHHQHWRFDPKARQKYPTDATIYGRNEEYIVKTHMSIGDDQVALLYKDFWYTNIYVIFALFPFFAGSICRAADGTQLLEFSGQGGGEYSTLRRPRFF